MHKLYQYQLGTREGLILQSKTGFGEIAPLPGFSKETLQEAKQETLEWIRTQNPPSLPSVRWGIACAEKPLSSVRLPLSALGAKEGFSTIKLKLGHLSLDEALDLVKTHYLKARLRLDFNRKWPLEKALAFASHFTPDTFDYLEEPVQTGLIEFSKQTNFPIALDESIDTDWSSIPSLKAIVVKPMIVGFIPKVPPHLQLILSSSYESGLGLLHIANTAQNNLPIGLDTVFKSDLLKNPISITPGFFSWEASTPLLNMELLCAL